MARACVGQVFACVLCLGHVPNTCQTCALAVSMFNTWDTNTAPMRELHSQSEFKCILTHRQHCRWYWLRDVIWSSNKLLLLSPLCFSTALLLHFLSSSLALFILECPPLQPLYLMGCLGRPTITIAHFHLPVIRFFGLFTQLCQTIKCLSQSLQFFFY